MEHKKKPRAILRGAFVSYSFHYGTGVPVGTVVLGVIYFAAA